MSRLLEPTRGRGWDRRLTHYLLVFRKENQKEPPWVIREDEEKRFYAWLLEKQKLSRDAVEVISTRAFAPPSAGMEENKAKKKDDAIRKIGTSGSAEESGLEEKGTPAAGMKALLEYVAQEDVIRTIAILAESGKTGDVTGDFPALQGLAKEAGFAEGVVAILRTVTPGEAVVGVPAEYAAQGIPVYVKKEWGGSGKISASWKRPAASGSWGVPPKPTWLSEMIRYPAVRIRCSLPSMRKPSLK